MGGVEYQLYNVGYIFKYDLDDYGGKTRIRYSSEWFTDADYSYLSMYYSSAKHLESLTQFCQTGIWEAFVSDSYRSQLLISSYFINCQLSK